MNSTFLALLVLSVFSIILYFISTRFVKKNKNYVEKYPEKEPKKDELHFSVELRPEPVLGGTIDPELIIKKEVKPKTPKKKSASLPSVSGDELPKSKKSTYKKSYNRKKKDTKKDKGDDLLLS